MQDITLSADQWHQIATRIFVAWGAQPDIAQCVAQSLVDSDLASVYSHGLIRVADYLGFVKAGFWHIESRPQIVRETGTITVVDGNFGFGQPAAYLALDASIAKARTQGIAAATILHSGHVGRLGEYMDKAAEDGVVALMAASSAGNGGVVMPYGGAERVFSTNPVAAGVPAREHPPFIMDFATTVVAAGKIEMSPDKDTPIPEGWALDVDGRPASTIRAFLEGGGLIPFGGHKGYALAILVELLCGALTGAGVSSKPKPVRGPGSGGNSAFLLVLDIPHFTDPDRFYSDVDGLIDRLEHVKPAPGFERVLIPGAPERAARQKNIRTGITLPGAIWQRIIDVAEERDVNLDDIVRQAAL